MMHIEFFFNYLLQNKLAVIKQALNGKLPIQVISGLLFLSAISLSLFGFMIGCSHSFLQGVASLIKLPVLFYTTTIICFPTLYIFLSLLGAKISFKGLGQFSLISISIMALILISFAPVSLFFLLVGTDYETYKLINVAIMAIAGSSGIYLFNKYILVESALLSDNFLIRRTQLFIKFWLGLFGLIGTNLSFVMSPFFGHPKEDFILFTTANENFFSHLFSILFGY